VRCPRETKKRGYDTGAGVGWVRVRIVRVEHRLHVTRIDQEALPCVQGGGGVGVDGGSLGHDRGLDLASRRTRLRRTRLRRTRSLRSTLANAVHVVIVLARPNGRRDDRSRLLPQYEPASDEFPFT
jgi:hypothetical protein